MFFTHGAPRDSSARDHHPVVGDQYSRHGRGFRTMKERLRHCGTTLQHTTRGILGASGECKSRLLKNTKERSSPSLCMYYVLSVNVGNVGKLCKLHRLPVSRARQRISPFSIHSLFGVISGKVAQVSQGLRFILKVKHY